MWYAIQIMSGQERQTAALCRTIIDPSVLLDIFCPQSETMRQRQGSWEKCSHPLFPGYLFVITDQVEELLLNFRQVPKLTRLLGTGPEPVALSNEEVEWLRGLLSPGYVAEFSTGFIEGDKLIIESGAMKGLEGLVKRIDRHKRTAVLEVEMFGRKVEMRMGLEVTRKG